MTCSKLDAKRPPEGKAICEVVGSDDLETQKSKMKCDIQRRPPQKKKYIYICIYIICMCILYIYCMPEGPDLILDKNMHCINLHIYTCISIAFGTM